MSNINLDIVGLAFAGLVISMIPVLAVLATSFTKIVVVLGLLRLALGIQQIPPNMVLNSLAIVLTAFIMAPVFEQGLESAKAKAPPTDFGRKFEHYTMVGESFAEPLKVFLDKHAPERERQFFIKAAGSLWPKKMVEATSKDSLYILIPSFVVGQLTEAFYIGFLLYIAFIVIDLIVSNALLAMGMQMVSPMTISIPFKLLLFVAIDGWSRLIQGLVTSYA
jgi:type III secretion protein R